MRVLPPTSTTASTSAGRSPASARACRHGASVRSMMGVISASSSARVSVCAMRRAVGKRDRDLGRVGRREPALGLFGRAPHQRLHVASRRHLGGDARAREQPRPDRLVDVVAAEAGVAAGRLHLEDAALHLEDGDVERAAAEVVDGDRALALLIETVGERRRRRLVDEPQHLETGQPPGVLGRLALGVVEVRRHGDDGLLDLAAERGLGAALQLLQDERRDLRGRVRAVADHEARAPRHRPRRRCSAGDRRRSGARGRGP